MKIHLTELEEIMSILNKSMKGYLGNSITIEAEDYYWQIPFGEEYDIYAEPNEHHIGSIHEDWQDLQRLLNKEETPISYDLVKLAEVLKVIKLNSHGKW